MKKCQTTDIHLRRFSDLERAVFYNAAAIFGYNEFLAFFEKTLKTKDYKNNDLFMCVNIVHKEIKDLS